MFEDVHKQKLMREGKPLPARAYSEDTLPYTSHWWPESVKILHREALREEDCLKNDFRRLFPCQSIVHPDRAAQSDNFRCASRLLNTKLGNLNSCPVRTSLTHGSLIACSFAIFFLRTRLQQGITVSAAARAGALAFDKKIKADEAAALAAAYSGFFFPSFT
jgi:hypothetical protein